MNKPSLQDDDFTRKLQRIDAQISAGQLAQAAQALNAARGKHARDPRLYLIGMRLAEKAGNPAGAVAAAERAVQLAPQWPVAIMELAMLHTRHGQHAQALEHARRAMALAADDYNVVRRAIGIAIQANDLPTATQWLRQVVAFQPDNRGFRQTLADHLRVQGIHAEALALYDALLAEDPKDTNALAGRVHLAEVMGDHAKALADTETLLNIEPGNPTYEYWRALFSGEKPATQPGQVVSGIFDRYAATFDVSLWRQLEYRVPQLAADRLLALHPERRFNLLDLGCGTGLVGVCLGRLDGHIIGVDLSEEMIRQAARHNVYSRFHQVNVLDALRDTPSDHYEAITACDVLVYVGDLAPVLPNAFRILKPGGHFIFSCETAGEDEEDLLLRATGRFAHKASQVERLCIASGFDTVHIEHLPKLRMEGGAPLPGFLVVAHKPAA